MKIEIPASTVLGAGSSFQSDMLFLHVVILYVQEIIIKTWAVNDGSGE